MKRRNVLLGLGALSAGGMATLGSGAFTSVEAERSVSVEVQNDRNAYLAVEPLDEDGEPAEVGREPEAQDTPYAEINDDGRLELTFTALNPEADTVVEEVFRIRNDGPQEVGVYIEKVEDNTDAVTFEDQDGNELEEGDAVRVEKGNFIDVDISFDTTNLGDDDNLPDEIIITGDVEAGDGS